MASILTKVAATDLMPTILAPTKEHFDFPLDAKERDARGEAVPFTVSYEDGIAYGTVAPWGRCLLDGSGTCWTPPGPESDDLSLSMQGLATLADGTKIAVGVLPFDQNHADRHLSGEGAIDAMAHSGRAFLRCRYFAGKSGICAAGVILPGVTYGDAVRIEAAATSGDWRALWQPIHDLGGTWRFTGAIVVNVPGLPLDTSRTVAETQAMYARAASARFANTEVVFSDMTDDLVSIGWAHAAAAGDPVHSRAVQAFIDESKKLTDQVAAERERITAKYEALMRNLSGVKVERGKSNRTTKRIQIRQQKSAELKQLREKTKQQRKDLAERRKSAVEQLRAKQRTEREQFTDKIRAERQRMTEGGADEQGQVMEGFRTRAKALQKRFEQLREQIRDEFADRSDAIKDLDADARPEARANLAEARRKKSAELRDRYTAEREQLAAERAKALEAFRVAKRKERNDLTDRQRAERERAKQGAATMPDTDTTDIRPGQTVTLLDGTVAHVAALADFDGATVIVTADGRVIDEFEVDDEAKTASAYRWVMSPRVEHYAEVSWAGGRGLACGTQKTADGIDMVSVRRIGDDGTFAPWGDEVLVPLAEVTLTGRRAEYAGEVEEDGRVEFDRVLDVGAAPAQVASACGCGGKVAMAEPPGNAVPSVEEPSGQIALERIAALEQQISDLEAKVDVLAKAKQEAEIQELDSVVASLRMRLTDVGA